MTGFILRALGLATLLYFIFVMPIGRKTLAQAAVEVWNETQLRHALEVKGGEIRHELMRKMHQWQKAQAIKGDIEPDAPSRDADADAQPPDYDAPPVPQPRHAPKGRPSHSRGRPGARPPAPSDDDHR